MKNQKGITLVALVITIIVLLILAGVSISLVLGQNGVLTQASNSVVQNRGAEAKQDLQLALASVETAYYTKWASNSATTRDGNAGVYADATDGLQKQLENAGYINVSITVANLFTAAGSEISIQKGSDVFNFKNVSVDKDSGSFSYVAVSPATKPVLEVVSGSKPAETIDL